MKKVMRWLNENECPICQNRLVLIQKETSYYDVDDDGNIEPFFNNFDSLYSTYLLCTKCNKEYPAEISGDKVTRIKKYPKIKKENKNPFYK